MISELEYKARKDATEGWTGFGVATFVAAIVFTALQFAWQETLVFLTLALGSLFCFIFAIVRRAGHFDVVKKYWGQPDIDKKKK